MRRLVLPCVLAAALPATAMADQFDGLYRLTPEADCALTGQEGGALKIEDGVFYGVESRCVMTRPVNVRDMDAVLYDMECGGEGTTWVERALFMTAADGGLIMVWNGYAFKYDRCDAPIPADEGAGKLQDTSATPGEKAAGEAEVAD